MIAVFIAPVYIAICSYILIRFLRALGYCSDFFKKKAFIIPVSVVFFLLALSPLIGFFMPVNTVIRRTIIGIGNYWFGIMLYTLLIIAISHLFSVLLRRVFKVIPKDFFRKKKQNIICILLTILIASSISTYGILNAQNIKVNDNYNVTVNKVVSGDKQLKVVLIADIHIGYSIGVNHLNDMVEKINQQKPDIVCIAGDIYDNDYDAFENPESLAKVLSQIKSKYGTYACWGNHDVNQKILGGFTFDNEPVIEHDKRMAKFLEDSNIKILEDDYVLIDDQFYVVGRIDGEKPATENGTRKTPEQLLDGLDHTKPIIVIAHEPDELQETANAGADVLLCGHVHDGQLFPANIVTAIVWENSCGYLQKGNMHNIVTSGVGIWGPFMRVGTDSEICDITVNFKNEESQPQKADNR